MSNKNFNITEVTDCHGGECHLVKYDGGATLCDTGFAFTAPAVANNIRKALGGNALDSIMLTHAHYDHAGGAPYIKAAFPEANLIVNELTAKILTRPGALRTMREMTDAARTEFEYDTSITTGENEMNMSSNLLDMFSRDTLVSTKASKTDVSSDLLDRFSTNILTPTITNKPGASSDLLDNFSADILVPANANGARITKGILAYATPGHTRDMTSYYLDSLDLLIATETTGVIVPAVKSCTLQSNQPSGTQNESSINPTFITGYAQALNASKQIKEIGARYILTPHYGLISGKEALNFPDKTRTANEAFADFIMSRHNRGLTDEEILRDYLAEYYEKLIRPTGKQPLAAVLANVRVTIPRLITELGSSA
jgi:glyoxylase-like metal-dependent hydrolase (beta-lactamase superfamily II)